MFGRAGLAYVYRIHRSHCLNVVTGPVGRGEAVLIRAVEPVAGIERMRASRARASIGRHEPDGVAIANGPGKLCQALALGIDHDGIDLLERGASAPLSLEPRLGAQPPTTVTKRIGISVATEAPLRFAITENPWVSPVRRRG